MSNCLDFITVCSQSGSAIGALTAPNSGVYHFEYWHLGNKYSNSATLEEGDSLTTLRPLNEDSIIKYRVIYNGEYVEFDGISTFYLKTIQCFDYEATESTTPSQTFEYLFENESGADFELDGLDIEDANVLLSYPGAGSRYRIVVYRAGARQSEGLHYTYNRTTGTISFLGSVPDGEDIIIEFQEI